MKTLTLKQATSHIFSVYGPLDLAIKDIQIKGNAKPLTDSEVFVYNLLNLPKQADSETQ